MNEVTGLYAGLTILSLLALSAVCVPFFLSQRGQAVRRTAIPLTATTFVLLALAGIAYIYLGATQGLIARSVLQTPEAQTMLANPNLNELTQRLRTHLSQAPESAQGWYLLGKLYLSQGERELAQQTLAKAHQLRPRHVPTTLFYAQALFYAPDPQSQAQAKQLLLRVLQVQPQNPMALNLLALTAYRAQAYQQAIDYWEQLLPMYSAQSEDGQALLTAIAKAQQQLHQEK